MQPQSGLGVSVCQVLRQVSERGTCTDMALKFLASSDPPGLSDRLMQKAVAFLRNTQGQVVVNFKRGFSADKFSV